MSRLLCCVTISCALSFTATSVHAQVKYPTQPIRLLTPFAPGGGSDILARIIGPQVSEALGQQIIVDNRPGGGGTLGAAIAVRSDPDGHTLILVSGSYGANAALHDLPYDSVTDITPIILIGTTGLLVPVGDHGAMAAAALRVLGDPVFSGAMCAAALVQVRQYAWPEIREKWRQAYWQVGMKRRKP